MTTTPALDEQAEAEIFSLLKTIRDLDGLDITDDEIRDGHHRIEGYVWLAEHAYRFGIERERDAAREELAKTRAELKQFRTNAELLSCSTMGEAFDRMEQTRAELAEAKTLLHTIWYGVVNAPARERWLRLIADANPATTAEPTTLPLLPDIAHMTTPPPDDDDDVPPMAVGIIPNCARCDAPMFVGHRCPDEAEPADEPKATCGIECTELPPGTHPLGGMHIGTCALPPGHDGTHDPDAREVTCWCGRPTVDGACTFHGRALIVAEPKATVPPAYNLPPKHCGELRVHAPHADSSTICDGRTLPADEPKATNQTCGCLRERKVATVTRHSRECHMASVARDMAAAMEDDWLDPVTPDPAREAARIDLPAAS